MSAPRVTVSRLHARSRATGTALLVAAFAAALGVPLVPAAAAGPAPTPGDILRLFVTRTEARLREASEARLPPLVPPVPVPVAWRARRISSLDLGAPLLALAAGDVDGDARGELVALTTGEVVVLELRGRRTLAVIARAPLPAEPAAIQPRDPVGALVVADLDGNGTPDIAARSSPRARGVWLRWRAGALAEIRQAEGFPLCAGVTGELDPGRNYFDAASVRRGDAQGAPRPARQVTPTQPRTQSAPIEPVQAATTPPGQSAPPERLFGLRCRDDLVDPAGRPLRVEGALRTDGTLALTAEVTCRSTDRACPDPPSASRTLADNGYAFELADVDRNGHPEVIVAAAAAPGDGDKVTVLTWRGGRLRGAFTRTFSGGVVALAAADLEGRGAPGVLAAVRLPGSTRFDLWTFNG